MMPLTDSSPMQNPFSKKHQLKDPGQNSAPLKEGHQEDSADNQADDFFLPDFCDVRMVFAVVVIGELLAIVLTLAPMDRLDKRWEDLSVISLFIQWVALLSAGVLCLSREWLSRQAEAVAAALSYILLLFTASVISEITYWAAQWFTLGEAVIWRTGFLISNLGISSIVSAVVLRYFYVQHQWGRNLQAKSQARIQALHSRIRPHFLFNSLNTIASLTRIDPELAESATEALADLFRGSLAESRSEVSLADEINLCQRYLHIERLRLGDRLQESWQLDQVPMDALIPQLSLQPLVENAVYHGIEHLSNGGLISIKGRLLQPERGDPVAVPLPASPPPRSGRTRTDAIIEITITNPVSDLTRNLQRNTNKMAQENVALRLHALHGRSAQFIVANQGDSYQITMRFPYTRQQN